jgi:hypothetical protein
VVENSVTNPDIEGSYLATACQEGKMVEKKSCIMQVMSGSTVVKNSITDPDIEG